MVLPKRRSILSKEERIDRLKEARQKYNQIGKSKKPPAPPTIPIAPRASVAQPPIKSLRPPRVYEQPSAEDDFKIDPASMAMIKSGRINIPTMNRPSMISAPRHTIGARQSLIGRPFSRFRASIAAQEPRPSLLPLGINVFEANASQRNEVSEFLNSIITSTTPAKPSTSTAATPSFLPNNIFSATTTTAITATARQRKIRFLEVQHTAIQECRESAESEEVAAVATSSESEVKHSPILDTSFMPPSILSTKKNMRKKVNLADGPAPTPRKINFDDVEDSTEEPTQENKENDDDGADVEKDVANLGKLLDSLLSLKSRLSADQLTRIEASIAIFQQNSPIPAQKSPEKRKFPVPMTPLGSIMETMRIEEEVNGGRSDGEEEEEREMEEAASERKKRRRSSRMMKVGGDLQRRSTLRRSSRGLFNNNNKPE